MNDLTTYILTLLILIIGAWIIFYYYLKQKKLPDIDKNFLIKNPNSEHTNSHAIGWLVGKIEPLKNGLTRLKYYPIDLNKEEKENNELIIETAICDGYHIIKRGDVSGMVNIVNIKPDSMATFFKTIPLWSFNGVTSEEILKKDYASSNVEKMYGLGFDSLLKTIPEMMEIWKGGEIGSREIAKFNAFFNELENKYRMIQQTNVKQV